jgi:hypothetical protein
LDDFEEKYSDLIDVDRINYNTFCIWLASEMFSNYTDHFFDDKVVINRDINTLEEMNANKTDDTILDYHPNIVQLKNPEMAFVLSNLLNRLVLIGYKNPNFYPGTNKRKPGHWGTTYPSNHVIDYNNLNMLDLTVFETGNNPIGVRTVRDSFGKTRINTSNFYVYVEDYIALLELLLRLK